MAFLVAFLASLLVGANAQTDCNAVHESWYGESCENAMTCSGTFACVVPDNCQSYTCVQGEWCPDGTFYLPFYPTIEDGETSPQEGFACYPPEFVAPESFNCDFGDGPSYQLSVLAKVPPIVRNHDWDDRNITLVSWDAYLEHNAAEPWLIFDESACKGIVNDDGDVIFNEVVNGEDGCYFTNLGMETDDMGIPFYNQKFVIGFDDLLDYYPNGDFVYKRRGKNWIVNCRVKAWEVGFVNPGADGERDELEVEIETPLPFTIEMFRDDTFQTPFDNGEIVDIGGDSLEEQTIYVQVAIPIEEVDEEHLIHIKHCKINEKKYNTTEEDWVNIDYTFDFVVDGCLLDQSNFISRNFDMRATRVQFANPDNKTYMVDQFMIDLWDPNTGITIDPFDEIKIEIECEMVACEVEEFFRTDSNYTQNSFCWLNDHCTTDDDSRYTNLKNTNLRAGQYKEGKTYEHSQSVKSNGNIIYQTSTPSTPSTPGSSVVATAYFSVIVLLIALVY